VGVAPFPELTDPSVSRDTRIYFFLGEAPANLTHERALFRNEKELERFLVANFYYVPIVEGLRLRRPQYLVGGKRVDICCEETETDRLVGVGLKCREADSGLPVQMNNYMRRLERLAAKENRSGARGMVITGQPTPAIERDLRTLCKRDGHDVSWHYYTALLDTSISPRWA